MSTAPQLPPPPHDPLHLWNGTAGAEAAQQWVSWHLAQSRAAIARMLAANGPRTVANTLRPYDRAGWHLRMAGSQSGVMFMVHPDAGVRDAAQQLQAEVSAEGTALSLNREVYAALQALDASAEDAATHYFLERALLGYRLSGVDRDEPTRQRIRELADAMTELSLQFSRRVQDDVRSIEIEDANLLAGLPEDYLQRHGIRAEGAKLAADAPVRITTDPPDMTPLMNYAADAGLRRQMYLAYNGRGYPENKQVLMDLLKLRGELAQILGFRSWADLATVDQMMGSAAEMRSFLLAVEHACAAGATREWEELTSFVRSRDASALPLTLSDARFWEEQFRRAKFDFDSQSVRPYFPYAQVESGILRIAGELFHLQFRHASDAVVWAKGVKAFDVIDLSGEAGTQTVCGRIYLDMHPREGKSKWFSECSLVGGVLGEQLPEASLVCNFPEPSAEDAGLMQFSDVVTYFHEFGHLMHEILGGRQRWAAQSGIATEGDFVEVPSQMLEEFFDDPEMLRSFATHFESGEPIPYDIVAKMTAAAAHGRALSTLTQVMYATYSMETHDLAPADHAGLDLDALLRAGYDRFSRYEFVDGNRMYAAFTHLVGYTSNYYTYLYDKVIALEFFAEFANQPAATAMRYRQAVLEPGGSMPARDLVQNFLGREVQMKALEKWIGAQSGSSVESQRRE